MFPENNQPQGNQGAARRVKRLLVNVEVYERTNGAKKADKNVLAALGEFLEDQEIKIKQPEIPGEKKV